MTAEATVTTPVPAKFRIADLHESPFNERKHFDPIKLQELADNIKAEGVLQPLLVRPRIPPMFAGDPDAAAGHEVVFGHRRLRAAALAGLEVVPCFVRAMTDAEVRSAQISENLQRENVSALEEAEAMREYMTENNLSVADLVTRTGKTRSYVYGRLKLLDLNPTSRKAFEAGEMQIEIALVLARMPNEKLQLDALAKIKSNHIEGQLTDGGKEGYRRIRDFLQERYMTDLNKALFPLEDVTLLDGAGACTTCPKRAGQTLELFADIAEQKPRNSYSTTAVGPNTCTDPDCYAEKKKAHLRREQKALEAKGQVVVAGNAARNAISATGEIKGGYVDLNTVKDAIKGKTNVTIVTIQDPRSGKTKKAVKVADVKAAGVKVKEEAPRTSAEAERKKREAEHARREEKWSIEKIARRKLLDVTRAAIAAAPRTTFDLQVIAGMAFATVQWYDRPLLAELWGTKDMEKRIGSMSAEDAARFMIDCAIIARVDGDAYLLDREPEMLNKFAKHYGVDTKLARIGGLTPTPAAQATTRAAAEKPAKKSALSPPANAAARGPAQRVKTTAAAAAASPANPGPAAAGKRSGPPAKYRCATSGQTWSGKGLMPAWLKKAIGDGGKLADYEVKDTGASGAVKAKDNAGVAGEGVKDEAGSAGQASALASDEVAG